jgi:hypothetical protein
MFPDFNSRPARQVMENLKAARIAPIEPGLKPHKGLGGFMRGETCLYVECRDNAMDVVRYDHNCVQFHRWVMERGFVPAILDDPAKSVYLQFTSTDIPKVTLVTKLPSLGVIETLQPDGMPASWFRLQICQIIKLDFQFCTKMPFPIRLESTLPHRP